MQPSILPEIFIFQPLFNPNPSSAFPWNTSPRAPPSRHSLPLTLFRLRLEVLHLKAAPRSEPVNSGPPPVHRVLCKSNFLNYKTGENNGFLQPRCINQAEISLFRAMRRGFGRASFMCTHSHKHFKLIRWRISHRSGRQAPKPVASLWERVCVCVCVCVCGMRV